MTIALVGNPNCGKTTLFNVLTNSHYSVGNRIGVTVEEKSGYHKGVKIVDLPGIYSLTPDSREEQVTRNFVETQKPDLILNIVDATNLKRNLYLTKQLSELGIPMVIALNMIDAIHENGIEIDVPRLKKAMGIPIVPISAAKETGLDELFGICLKNKVIPKKCKVNVSDFITIKGENKQSKRTEKIDSFVTHPLFALPILLIVMFAIFYATFGTFGQMLSDFVDVLFNTRLTFFIEKLLTVIHANAFLKSLIVDGILSGIGGVIAFFPQIMLLALFLSLLEDSGYMARCAFIMDKLFYKIGLSGKSFVPMLMGFGCSVPAIMSVRTLDTDRSRKLTMLLIPFMSCGAKMPVYAVFAAALFPDNTAFVIFSLYLIGILLAIISGLIFSRTILNGSEPPLILEIPPYRMPTLKSTLTHIRERVKDFAMRVGTVLLIASIIIWLMQNLDFTLHMVFERHDSMIGKIGQAIAPVFAPCGFGNWQSAVSLISGFAAKEAVLTTMSILYGVSSNAELSMVLSETFNPLSAYAFLIFILLYVPCVAAVSTFRTESNSIKLTVFSVVYQLFIAWTMSTVFYQVGCLFM